MLTQGLNTRDTTTTQGLNPARLAAPAPPAVVCVRRLLVMADDDVTTISCSTGDVAVFVGDDVILLAVECT